MKKTTQKHRRINKKNDTTVCRYCFYGDKRKIDDNNDIVIIPVSINKRMLIVVLSFLGETYLKLNELEIKEKKKKTLK